MAVNESGSLNGSLREGLSDGTVKKLTPNRGGAVSSGEAASAMFGGLPQDRYDPSFSTAVAADVANRQTSL